MKAIIFFSLSKKQNSRHIAEEMVGDHFEIKNLEKPMKCIVFIMFKYGYKTLFNKEVLFEIEDIDFDKYDEVVLVSPVWAGKANAFMKQYLRTNTIKGKDITIIGSCSGEGGYKGYFNSFDSLIDESNNVIEHIMFVKRAKVYERKVL